MGNLLFAQDYIVDERFDPDEYEASDSIYPDNFRVKECWGLNTNLGEDDELISVWGSNLFAIAFKYDRVLFKGAHWNIGGGYQSDNYKFKNRSDMMLHDSIGHEKVKLRVHSITFESGFRFQTSPNLFEAVFFEVSGYANVNTFTKYSTWDEKDGMDLRSQTKKLNYVNPYNYGVEAKLGISVISIFAKYRLSDVFTKESGYRELPRLSVGLAFEVGAN